MNLWDGPVRVRVEGVTPWAQVLDPDSIDMSPLYERAHQPGPENRRGHD